MKLRSEAGFTLIETLVVLFAGALVFGSITSSLLSTTGHYHDRRMVEKANEQAHLLLDLVSFELRFAGAGMPMGQENFDMTNTALGDAPLPILTTATTNYLQYRLNEKGTTTMLSSDFTPALLSVDFSVASVAGFAANDIIYISDAAVGGKSGLKGVIASISGTTITLAAGYIATPAATFRAGAFVNKVATVTLDSQADITRDTGTGAITLLPRSDVTFTYLTNTGTVLTPPLSRIQIRDSLSAIRVQVSVDTEKPLKDGDVYSAAAQETIQLRNLHLARY